MIKQERWLRIIPVALIMYTISYIDRTNVSLALDGNISHMMRDLLMDDRMKGEAFGIFFFGYVLLQIPGGYLASRWSPKKLVTLFLVLWGLAAISCGLVKTFRQFELVRFLLGVAESAVYPTTLVLLANWFPKAERARATGYWNLCQPMAVALSAPLTGWLLATQGWKFTLVLEGLLPVIWIPIWWFFIHDHPREAPWISQAERDYLEPTIQAETAQLEPPKKVPVWAALARPVVAVMVLIYFLHNCAAYGCMSFMSNLLKSNQTQTSGFEYGLLFAGPYLVTALVMVVVSWHSDKVLERRKHVLAVYMMSGVSLIASALLQDRSFWLSYAFLCFAIPGPFAAQAPFWAIPAETMPRSVLGAIIGLVNAVGNLGGFFGSYIVGWLKHHTDGITVPFAILGASLVVAGCLALALPKVAKPSLPRTVTY
jgi:MFS family permease